MTDYSFIKSPELKLFFNLLKKESQNLEVHEGCSHPNLKEAFIQALWNENAQNKTFRTLNNQTVKINYSGTWNDEAGPDFRNAKITFQSEGQTITKEGDIEIHIKASDWYNHKHDKNPAFSHVILHVIWEESPFYPEHLPTLCLKNQLAPELLDQVSRFDWVNYPEALKYPPCPLAPYLAVKSNDQLEAFFIAAAVLRFHEKVNEFKKEIIKLGKAQALYQGLADALGYKNNRKQFKALTTALPYAQIKQIKHQTELTALLFGLSDLLPDLTSEELLPELKQYATNLWNNWWSKRLENQPKITWNYQGRPFNSPERRVAALAELLNPRNRTIKSLIDTALSAESFEEKMKHFSERLTIQNPLWESATSFKRRTSKPIALLGKGRIREIVVNIILPYSAAVNPSQKEAACRTFLTLPPLPDNHLLKEAVNRFLIPPARSKEIIKNNGIQQGMIKLIKEAKDVNHLSPHHKLIKLLLGN